MKRSLAILPFLVLLAHGCAPPVSTGTGTRGNKNGSSDGDSATPAGSLANDAGNAIVDGGAPADGAAPLDAAIPITCVTPKDAVTQSYRMALKRAPDDAGMAFWLAKIAQGESRLDVLRDIVRSPEFIDVHAAMADQDFVAGLYPSFFERTGDSAGITSHVGDLTNGMSRTDVALSFVDSPEFSGPALPTHDCFF